MYVCQAYVHTYIHTCTYIYKCLNKDINMEWVCSMKMDVGDGQGMLGEGGGLSAAG